MIVVKNRNFIAFEQDIRELLQAFFPGEQLAGEECGEAFFTLSVDGLMEGISLSGNRFEDKTVIKRRLYGFLSEKTGRVLPWGTLTGIKPVRLAEKILDGIRPSEPAEDTQKETALRILQQKYLISIPKARLMLEIALRERKLLRPVYENSGSLFGGAGYSFYIGIPFCPTRCLYCSFTSNPVARFENRVEEYLDDLAAELRDFALFADGHPAAAASRDLLTEQQSAKDPPIAKAKPSALYIGGGTPTALSSHQLEKLLDTVEMYTDTSCLLEYTVEAGRPDSITREKLEVLKKHGVGRISVNPQTMNQKTLDLIGRRHTVEQTVEAFQLARESGFDNINMDVIMGLPGETAEDVKHTLAVIEQLHPESLTVHALAVKRSARLSTEHDPWTEYERAEGDEVSQMTRMGAECAARMGMTPYYLYRQKNIAGNQENTGYAVPGKESLYNIIMMEEKQPVIGFGAGSTTKLDSSRRTENIKDLAVYLDRIGEVISKKRTFLEENSAQQGKLPVQAGENHTGGSGAVSEMYE